MFAAAIGAAAPLALAGKALNVITSIASEGKDQNFQKTLDQVARVLGTEGAEGPGQLGTPAGAPKPHAEAGSKSLAGAPLPPPPAISQQPIPPTVEGIHQLYATLRAMR